MKNFDKRIRWSVLFFSLAMTAVIPTGNAQSTLLKTFGGDHYDAMHTMIRSHDGGYIMAGSTESYGQGSLGLTDDYLVKIDSVGNVVWSTTLGLQGYDDIFSIEAMQDSGYVVCGIASDNNTYIGMLLAKISENGNVIWQKVLEQDHAGMGFCVRQTNDGGLIIAAEILLLDNMDFLLIKTDANGTVQWSRQIGGSDPDIPASIMQTADGGYLTFGVTRQNSATIPMYAVKTDSAGTVEWQRTYNTSPVFSRSTVTTVIAAGDGGYLVAGSNTNNQLFSDIMVMKIDSTGEPLWVKTYGGDADEFCGNMIQKEDGRLVVCGSSASSETGNSDALILLLDQFGNLEHSSLFGTTSADDEFVSVLSLATGGYVLGGNTASYSSSLQTDLMLIRTDSLFNGPACATLEPAINQANMLLITVTDFNEAGVIISGTDVSASINEGVSDSLICDVATGEEIPITTSAKIGVHPNPAENDLTFTPMEEKVEKIEIYNAIGIKISTVSFSQHVNISKLENGFYFIRFINGGGEVLQVAGFVKE